MKVKDLIELLQQCNADDRVVVAVMKVAVMMLNVQKQFICNLIKTQNGTMVLMKLLLKSMQTAPQS